MSTAGDGRGPAGHGPGEAGGGRGPGGHGPGEAGGGRGPAGGAWTGGAQEGRDSYYGRPVLAEPVWRSPDVPGYLFLGGLAGASSALAASAQAAGAGRLARAAKVGAAAAIGASAVALVHDLGRPGRFLNMLRVVKVSSPMSIGSWLLAAYGPTAGAAAFAAVTGRMPRAGVAATAGAGILGPAIATYTAALLCDTAVPAWHEAHREMPLVFAGSAATAAGGLGLVAVPPAEAGPALRLAVLGAMTELTAKNVLVRRLGPLARAYTDGRAGAFLQAGEVLTACGLVAVALGGRSRMLAALGGASLVAASAVTRFGIFEAGRASARDPAATVAPQRQRRDHRPAEPASVPIP